MGTKISEFIDLTSDEVETNKEHIWIPTYVDQAVRDNNNFRIKVSDIKGNGGNSGELLLQHVNESSGCIYAKEILSSIDNKSELYGTFQINVISGDVAIIPIYEGESYQSFSPGSSSWSWANESGRPHVYTSSGEHTIPFHFGMHNGKKIIAIGIKGSNSGSGPAVDYTWLNYTIFGK